MDYCFAVLVALVCLSSPTISRTYLGSDSYDGIRDYEFDHWHPGDYEVDPSWDSSDGSKLLPPDFHSSEEPYWDTDSDYEHHEKHEHGHGHDKLVNNGVYICHKDHGYSHHHYDHHDHGNHHDHHDHHDDNKRDNHENPRQKARHSAPSHKSQGTNYYKEQVNNEGKTNDMKDVKVGQPGRHSVLTLTLLLTPGQSGSPQTGQNNQSSSTIDADRVIFPDLRQTRTTSPSPTQPPSSTPTTPSTTSTTPPVTTSRASPSALRAILVCLRSCPVTLEYNPVCGANNFTYSNEGVLNCARNCGINLTLASRGPCGRPTPTTENTVVKFVRNAPDKPGTEPTTQKQNSTASTTTSTTQPTRYTNIDIPTEDLSILNFSATEIFNGVMSKKPQAQH